MCALLITKFVNSDSQDLARQMKGCADDANGSPAPSHPPSTAPAPKRSNPVLTACLRENMENLRELIEGDSSLVHEVFPTSGQSMLHMACRKGNFEMVEFLTSKGVDINAEDMVRCSGIRWRRVK